MALPPQLSDHLRRFQWILPPAIALVAGVYQLGPGRHVHDPLHPFAYYAIEILIYGTVGTAFVYFILRAVRSWALQKEKAEAGVYPLNADLQTRVEGEVA